MTEKEAAEYIAGLIEEGLKESAASKKPAQRYFSITLDVPIHVVTIKVEVSV